MSLEEIYKGHVITKDGEIMPPVTLRSTQEVFSYTQLQGMIFHEVRITDSLDYIVVQMVEGKYTYPPSWVKAYNISTHGLSDEV
jgi:hypothetical protein